jgi:uncharacterized membrane protein YczE
MTGTALPARIGRALIGTVSMGVGVGMQVTAHLGLTPWDVLHAAIARWWPGITFGGAVILVTTIAFVAWLGLPVRPGVGTVLAIVVVPLTIDVVLAAVPTPSTLLARVVLLAAGTIVFAAGTASYLRADLGPGPRDGLMLGLVQRDIGGSAGAAVRSAGTEAVRWLLLRLHLGAAERERIEQADDYTLNLRAVRWALDAGVLLIGVLVDGPMTAWANGDVGVGTIVVTAATGPLISAFLSPVGLVGLRPRHRPEPGATT